MKRSNIYKIVWVVSILAVVSLACALTGAIDDLREGQKAIETVQGIATQIDESGIGETAQAMVTQIDESGIKQTVQGAITEIAVAPGEIPDDIPIMEGNQALVSAADVISYMMPDKEFQEVVDYYKNEMPAKGWVKLDSGSESDNLTTLEYEKDGRKVSIVITKVPVLNQVTVLISIQ